MLNVMKNFYTGIRSMPVGWQVWVMALMAANMFIPIFYAERMEAQIIFAAAMAGGMIGMVLVKLQGFTKLLGLMHIFWAPLVVYLVMKLTSIPATDFYGQWIRSVIVLNGVSLVIDACDVFRYFQSRKISANA